MKAIFVTNFRSWFKPANVSKLMGAGEFYANNYDKPYDSFEYVPDDELRANQINF